MEDSEEGWYLAALSKAALRMRGEYGRSVRRACTFMERKAWREPQK